MNIKEQKWIVSYDNAPAVRAMYKDVRSIVYDISYSARSPRQGSEVMFFCEGLQVPTLGGAMNPVEDVLLIG